MARRRNVTAPTTWATPIAGEIWDLKYRLRDPDGEAGDPIPSGGLIPASNTDSIVDIDHFLNMFDEETRESLQRVLLGLRLFVEDRGPDGNRALEMANPFLSAFRRLATELNRDERALEELLVSGARFSGALAERRDDLAGFVREFRTTFGALASEREALADLINEFPDFMRAANTTFVNLRATLDDLDVLVAESKPATKDLAPLFGDAGSATLVEASESAEPSFYDLKTDGTGFGHIIVPAGGFRRPASEETRPTSRSASASCYPPNPR
jgi:phospholipid/cholesterol/gamma-HCH transport system substrate-binding protein